jgi:hypothetical protein
MDCFVAALLAMTRKAPASRRPAGSIRAGVLICRRGKSNLAFGLRQINPTGKSLLIFRNDVKPLLQKYFASLPTQISSLIRTVSAHTEGRCARHETRDGMRWTRAASGEQVRAGRMMPTRTAKSCRSGAPMPASSLREEAQATVSNKHGHRGEREVSRKTIARGMPGRSGVTVVTTLVCLFFHTRGCGRIERPAFPAPSVFREAKRFAQLGRNRAARSRKHILNLEYRHCERSEAIHSFLTRPHGLLRFARNDGVGTRAALSAVIARLDRAIQYSEASVMEPRSRGVLDTPHARGMTAVGGTSDSGFDVKREREPPTKHLRPSSGIS